MLPVSRKSKLKFWFKCLWIERSEGCNAKRLQFGEGI